MKNQKSKRLSVSKNLTLRLHPAEWENLTILARALNRSEANTIVTLLVEGMQKECGDRAISYTPPSVYEARSQSAGEVGAPPWANAGTRPTGVGEAVAVALAGLGGVDSGGAVEPSGAGGSGAVEPYPWARGSGSGSGS